MNLYKWKSSLLFKKYLTKSILEMHFTVDVKRFSFIPGQFVGIQVPTRHVPRAYSIVKKIKNRLVFLIDITPNGINSQYFNSMNIGDYVLISGPFGRFSLNQNLNNKYFICTSTGVAPFLAMLDEAIVNEYYTSVKFNLIFGCRYLYDDFVKSKIKKYFKNSNFIYVSCFSREADKSFSINSTGINFNYFSGRVTDYLKSHSQNLDINGDFYICGGSDMVNSVRSLLIDMRVKNIFVEKYD